MAGHRFETRVPIAHCGCGGDGVVWANPSDFKPENGTIEAFCSKNCGIGVHQHAYGPDLAVPRDYRKAGMKVVRAWNRAMGGSQ
jgi:hypothetical protein